MKYAKRIGVVGTLKIDKKDIPLFFWLGRTLFKLGHELVCIQQKGTVRHIREGFEAEGGSVEQIGEHLVEATDQTLAFVDDRLLKAMTKRYPDIEDRADIVVIWPDDYEELRQACLDIMESRGITPP